MFSLERKKMLEKIYHFLLNYPLRIYEPFVALLVISILNLSIKMIKQKKSQYLSGKIKGYKMIGRGFLPGEIYYKECLFKYYCAEIGFVILLVIYGCIILLKISKGIK